MNEEKLKLIEDAQRIVSEILNFGKPQKTSDYKVLTTFVNTDFGYSHVKSESTQQFTTLRYIPPKEYKRDTYDTTKY